MKLLSLSFLPQSRRFSEVSANHNVRQFAIPKSESFQKIGQVTI
jgi:hypothetical protein